MSAEEENTVSEASDEVLKETEEAELHETETVKPEEEEEEAEIAEAEKKEEELEEKVEKKKAGKPEAVGEEHFYTIPLRHVYVTRNIRTPKAVKYVRDYVKKHLKPEDVKIDEAINEFIWQRGIEKPPAKIHVRVIKDKEGVATVYPVKEK